MEDSVTGREPNWDEASADQDPFVEFGRWYAAAEEALPSPEAMALATVGPEGRPSSRMVLLKGWDDDGFVFFTNYEGRKSKELAERPVAALMFYWEPLGRQVRIEGPVTKTSREESDAYFASRPRVSQVGAVASAQSRPIEDRATFDRQVAEVEARFAGQTIPRPAHWGGWRVTPEHFEFWQDGEFRLHDRLVYDRTPDGWSRMRLQP